jgi:hypothetical protein
MGVRQRCQRTWADVNGQHTSNIRTDFNGRHVCRRNLERQDLIEVFRCERSENAPDGLGVGHNHDVLGSTRVGAREAHELVHDTPLHAAERFAGGGTSVVAVTVERLPLRVSSQPIQGPPRPCAKVDVG